MKAWGGLAIALTLLVQAGSTSAQRGASMIDPRGAVGLDGPYDENNPFARILREELPVAKVYEDSDALVFIPLAELSPGHVLVIPKRPVRNLLDLKHYEFRDLMLNVQRAARAQREALGATGFKVIVNNGVTAGQTVMHLHFHVIPTYSDKPLDLNSWRPLSQQEMNRMAARLADAWQR